MKDLIQIHTSPLIMLKKRNDIFSEMSVTKLNLDDQSDTFLL